MKNLIWRNFFKKFLWCCFHENNSKIWWGKISEITTLCVRKCIISVNLSEGKFLGVIFPTSITYLVHKNIVRWRPAEDSRKLITLLTKLPPGRHHMLSLLKYSDVYFFYYFTLTFSHKNIIDDTGEIENTYIFPRPYGFLKPKLKAVLKIGWGHKCIHLLCSSWKWNKILSGNVNKFWGEL